MTKEIKNIDTFDVIYDRILKSTSAKNQKELSEILGISQSLISDAKRRHVIPPSILILLLDKFNISPNYIRYGVCQ